MKFIPLKFSFLFLMFFQLQGTAQDFNSDISQALKYENDGQYADAANLFAKWIPIAKEEFGKNDTSFYYPLVKKAGGLYFQAGYYEQAEPLINEAVQIAKRTYGENHTEYSFCLTYLAALYHARSQYELAEPLLKEIILLYKASLGENDPSYSTCLSNLGLLYHTIGKYGQAEPLLKEAVQIAKASLGENDPNYSTYLNNLGQLYQATGQYKQAELLMKEVMRIYKASFGENHPSYALALNNLAVLYGNMGRYEQANLLMKEAMSVDKASLGVNHPDFARDLNNLAALYKTMGHYEQAEPLMKEALRIDKASFGENHPAYGRDLSNLALLYSEMGRIKQAEPLIYETIQIYKASLGVNHPDYGLALNNLASLYQEMGRYDQAEKFAKEAMQITKESLGVNHPDFARDLNNLAQLYQSMGHYEQAEPLMKEALRIDKASFGENHPAYCRNLNNLAQLYCDMGRYEQAEQMIKETMQLDKASLGVNHPDYGIDLHNLALCYQAMGQYKKVEPLMKEAYSILKNNLRNNASYLSETELSQFHEKIIYTSAIYQSINYQQTLMEIDNSDFAMDIELYQKGLLLNSVIETRKLIFKCGDTSLINSYQTIMTYRKQAEKLNSMTKEQRYDDPVLLEVKANELEKDMKLGSKEYRRSLEEAEITWKQVHKNLRPDEAVVEFASFEYYNIQWNKKQWTDSTIYCALVLRKQDTIPHMVYLFEERQLAEALPKPENSSDAIINNTYATLRGTQLVPDSSLYQGENLYNLVWNPLDSLLSGIRTVNYACSGLLNTVSFAAIPDASGKLLCEKYALNQYSSTRNLAIETKELPVTDATIYGGIQYELDTTLMIANARQYSKSNDLALAYNSTRSGNKRGKGFVDLDNTLEEANTINTLFKKKKIVTNYFTEAAANEESFKAMANKKSPSVIHLATHGFYYPDTTTQRKRSNELQFTSSDINRFQYSPDPLLRSGIVLAGANRVWRGEPVPDGVEDGILTAKDVSQLDLLNTQLVVLSACQTGLGDVKGSEGVFGLQRAFKMAGVRYLIMSLWSVPDKETKEFMEKFYTHWLTGIPIRSAFQTTQQDMRLQYPQDPYKWAAFVLVE